MKVIDAHSVSALAKRTIINLKYYNPIARKTEIKRYTSDALKKKVKEDKYSVLVAYVNSKIVGFCFNKIDDFTIWLEWFGVDSDARGIGVGKALLNKLEQTAIKRKAHKIWCDCRTSNQKSINILSSLGYKMIATIPDHWYRQDFILWHKPII